MSMNRRRFLQWAVALSAGAAFPQVAVSVDKRLPPQDLDDVLVLSHEFSESVSHGEYIAGVTCIMERPGVVWIMCDDSPVVAVPCPIASMVVSQDAMSLMTPRVSGKLWISGDHDCMARIVTVPQTTPLTINDFFGAPRTERILIGKAGS